MDYARPTKHQATQLRRAGLDPAKILIRRRPDAPRQKEREQIQAALKTAREEDNDLRMRRVALINAFLESDPDARELTAKIKELKTRTKVLASRIFYAFEIAEDGGWCTHVRGRGDNFADALRKAKGP